MESDLNEAARTARKRSGASVVVLVLVVAVLGGLGGIGYYAGNGPLWLVNGLDIPVVVELDGAPHKVGAGEKTSFWTHVGVHRVRVLREDGAVLEEDAFLMRENGSSAFNVYNVAGAAPVYVTSVVYSRSSTNAKDEQEEGEIFAGVRFTSRAQVDYPFKEPPSSIQADSRQYAPIRKSHANVAPGGWRASLAYLAEKDRKMAAGLLRSLASVYGEDRMFRGMELRVAERSAGPAGGLRAVMGWREAAPANNDAHRAYQNYMLRLGHEAEMVQEYKQWYEAGAKGPAEASLLARVLPLAEGVALVDEAMRRHAGAPLLLLRRGLLHFYAEEMEKAAELFAAAEGSEEHRYYAEEHALALVALGRKKEAAELLDRVLIVERCAGSAIPYARMEGVLGRRRCPLRG
ncbi:MAG: hypothetical protein R3F14_11895 [Polyangiaceae bacterium]